MEEHQEHSLGGRVFQRIREDILKGKYKQNDELKEATLGKELGVSRTPVREALRQLELEGLVSIVPNRGAYVNGISKKDIWDIYYMRSTLEGLCARWAVENSIRSKEAERILKYVKEDAYVITLEINGEQLTSEQLAAKVEQLGIQGTSHLVFIIGGSIGLGKEVLGKSDYALSFSKMTFPHQLMRVILLEQIYRSYRIINGEPYHK